MQLKAHNIVLRGERAVLRPMTEQDWDVLLVWNNDPEVLYFAEGDDVRAYSLEQLRDLYCGVSQSAFCFIIEVDEQAVGECWLQRMNLDRVLNTYPNVDCRRIDLVIGDKQFWGRGIGTEVIRLLTDFAFEHEQAALVFGCDIADYNVRSRRAFQKAGYHVMSWIELPPGGKARRSCDVVYANPAARLLRLGNHTMHAIQVKEYGGPEQLVYAEVPRPEPRAGEVCVEVEAAGVNFIDVYQRTGAYPLALPLVLGQEAAGTVAAVGQDVAGVKEGDRVAFASQMGAYAEYVVVPAAKVVPVPDGVDTRTAAAAILQGMTAHYLTHGTYPIKEGDQVLVHAAAGGLGLLLCQMAKRLGGYVIGTVSTEEKARLAREAGADEVIRYTEQDFVGETKRLTGGRGVHVVYDSVGKTTFDGSLDVLRPRGYMVLCGQSSGAVPPLNPQVLNAKGSLFLTRPALGHYTLDRAELLLRAGDLFNWIRAGELTVRVHGTFLLTEAAEAHRVLEARQTSGKVLLLPGG